MTELIGALVSNRDRIVHIIHIFPATKVRTLCPVHPGNGVMMITRNRQTTITIDESLAVSFICQRQPVSTFSQSVGWVGRLGVIIERC